MAALFSRKWIRFVGIGLLALLLITGVVAQLMVEKNLPVLAEPPWDSPETAALVQRACADCHSNKTVWLWYNYVPPFSLLVARDVQEGRQKLNFSEWVAGRRQETREIAESIRSGEMPPWIYYPTHPNARLSAAEQEQLIAGLKLSLQRP